MLNAITRHGWALSFPAARAVVTRHTRFAILPLASLAVPVVGVVSAPLLAHALGVEGRGEASAALAPFTLVANVATLGLPEALTYFVARGPRPGNRLLLQAALMVTPLAIVAALCGVIAAPLLANGDVPLTMYIAAASLSAIPAIYISLARGVAYGAQRWGLVAMEQISASLLKLVLFIGATLTENLTVFVVIGISIGTSLLAGIFYLPVLRRVHASDSDEICSANSIDARVSIRISPRILLNYGARIWASSIALVVYGRLGQLLLTPLAGVRELGLYVVAITISDAPLIVSNALKEAVFGIASRAGDARWLAATSRVTSFVTLIACCALGASAPLWITIVFGPAFEAALPAVWVLLVAALISVPGTIASAGLSAWNRPGAKSLIVVATAAINLIGFVLLAPVMGALGAALAGLASAVLSSMSNLTLSARVLGLRRTDFILVKLSDFRVLYKQLVAALVKRINHPAARP